MLFNFLLMSSDKSTKRKRQAKSLLCRDPLIRPKSRVFVTGNIDYYYFHRHDRIAGMDHRLRAVSDFVGPDAFMNKSVLDLGCGQTGGHVTFVLAKLFAPALVLGLDQDQRNVFACCRALRVFKTRGILFKESKTNDTLPSSLIKRRGVLPYTLKPWNKNLEQEIIPSNFPFNVSFGLYEPGAGGLGIYDFIFLFGIVKWTHLNSGDDAVKRLFERVAAALKEGGVIVMEALSWASYKSARNVSMQTRRNFDEIRLRPAEFNRYLEGIGLERVVVLTAEGGDVVVYKKPIV
jgi:7SK snRNA methylphosphate capping enzyme